MLSAVEVDADAVFIQAARFMLWTRSRFMVHGMASFFPFGALHDAIHGVDMAGLIPSLI